jgi:hypothetical protein
VRIESAETVVLDKIAVFRLLSRRKVGILVSVDGMSAWNHHIRAQIFQKGSEKKIVCLLVNTKQGMEQRANLALLEHMFLLEAERLSFGLEETILFV